MFYFPEGEEPIHHFSLAGLLQDDESIAVDYQYGYVSYLCTDAARGHLKKGMLLTLTEVRILVPLLSYFPYYCPYEVLHATYTSGRIDELIIHNSRLILQDASQQGYWNQEFRSVRGVISRVRQKLTVFDLDIGSIIQTGYQLQKLGQKLNQKPLENYVQFPQKKL
jgi:hypothetical protein